ncbi:unnamed protein product [Effrenium voratum]|nr:unnamed protein product [Effrenium voratum]
MRRPLAAAALLCLARHGRVFTSSLRPGPLRRTGYGTWTGGRENGVLRPASVAQASAGAPSPAMTPEAAVQALLQAAGPGAGSPPPEVVGAALKATGVPATLANVQRGLQAALGVAPTAAQIAAATQAAAEGLAPDFFDGPAGDAATASFPAPTTPEEVVTLLLQAGPAKEKPPADVVGAALRDAGLEITADLGAALKAAMARPGPQGYGVGPTASQLPGAAAAAAPGAPVAGAPAVGAVQTPEEVVQALLQIAGPDAGLPPPEVLGTALRAAGLPVSRENVLRALRAAGVGGARPTEEDVQKALAGAEAAPAPSEAMAGAMSSPEEVIFALRMAAGPGAGTPPPEVVGAALRQAKVTPLSVEAVVRALKEAGHTSPSAETIQAALQAASHGLPES